MKKILIILDGASDLAHPLLNGRTPLEAAEMPYLDFFSEDGRMGYMYPINENIAPGSDNSLVSIFGNDPNQCTRGIYEAIGSGISFKNGDFVARINFGTIDNIKNRNVVDRRAGRTLTTKEANILAREINEKIRLPCEFLLVPTVGHRGVLILKNQKFSKNISNIDPEWVGSVVDNKQKSVFEFSKPLDKKFISQFTSFVLNEFVTQVFRLMSNNPINLERVRKGFLPANMIFIRGSGIKIPKIKKYRDWISINSMPLEKGFSIVSGMSVKSFKYPELKSVDSYKNLYNGLNKSIKFAIKTIKKNFNDYNCCYIQFKETDIPGHDNKPIEKKKMLELIDKKFFSFLKMFFYDKNFKLVVTCDHSTPCKLKSHSADSVPVLVYDGYNDVVERNEKMDEKKDGTFHFCEIIAKEGSLGKIYGKDFMKITGLA